MLKQYRGFTKANKRISQGFHYGDAVDVSMTWGTPIYAPYTKGNFGEIRRYKVIRANRIDKANHNVRYHAIQDMENNVCWGFFHVAKTSLKEGQIVKTGDFICKTANNGLTYGAHLHLVYRYPNFLPSSKKNPIPHLDIHRNKLQGIYSPTTTCEDKLKDCQEENEILEGRVTELEIELASTQEELENAIDDIEFYEEQLDTIQEVLNQKPA